MTSSFLNTSLAELLIESVTDYAIFMLDPNGIVTSWNTGARRLKGYQPEEIIGQHFSTFYSVEDQEIGLPQKAIETALTEGLFEAQGWRIRNDGTRFWANVVIEPTWDEAAQHIGFVKITRDFTVQKNTEEELRKSEERFRLLVKGVTDYAIYMLDPEGRVSSWNAGAERFKGYTEDEIIGENFSQFYPAEDREAGVPQSALAQAASMGHFEAEGWRLRKDGSRFWAHVVIDPIYNDGKILYGFTKITRDLTERKIAEDQLEASREQLLQSQKMEALGQLTGGMAHDFNNVLAAVLGSLRIAHRRQSKGEDGSEFIENAITAAERGAAITQRLLTFARKQDLALEPTDIIKSLNDMNEILESTIGKNFSIETDYPETLNLALADHAQLELAILNLVINARDAMPDGGVVTLRARNVQVSQTETPSVCISIEDQGHGMDKVTLSRAFEPFFTTKGVGKGSGLGLPMVKGMVEQSGGQLRLHSELGHGTIVEIILPALQQKPQQTAEIQKEPEADSANLRILVVDDEAIILMNTAMTLSDMGHDVLEAHSGAEALKILEKENVDLLVTDFAMPKMTGAELIAQAQSLNHDLKVILASGYVDLAEGVTVDAIRLHKPFSEADLAMAVQSVQTMIVR